MRFSKKTVKEIFNRFSQKKQDPRIELSYTTPYELLIAVILSAQATDKGVNKITPALFEVANVPQAIVNLGVEELKKYIKSINFFNNKAKNIVAMSRVLIEEFNSEIPDNLQDLIKLPGVGRKSANVMLNCIFKHETIAVDTHVFRVSNRVGLCNVKTPLEVEEVLMKIVPPEYMDRAHHWLVLHGRHTCKARRPLCENCLIDDLCKFSDKKYGKSPKNT